MGEYSPTAIRGCYDALTIPGKVFDGILGDAAHVYGYHRGRNWDIAHGSQGASDYSVTSNKDKLGDGDAASALDIGLPPDQMKIVTAELIAGLKQGDYRLRSVRECFGTVDGSTVTGWDALVNEPTTSDPSHLWHVHLSFYRQFCNDAATLLDVAAYLNSGASGSGGGTPITPITPVEDDDMAPFLVKSGDGKVWITDLITRRHVPDLNTMNDLIFAASQRGVSLAVPTSAVGNIEAFGADLEGTVIANGTKV